MPFRRADGSPRRVLYAEDQLTSRIVTTAMLEKMGFQVDAVEDGELALQRARNDNYDVILLDIEMPIMDGVTAARSIRKEVERAADTPILALSAFLADSTEHTKWRDAFDSALPKPANGNELMNALHKAIAFSEGKAKKLPAKPSREELVDALRGKVPGVMWRSLCRTAANEMANLVNVLEAAREAGDKVTWQLAATNIKGAAMTFGAGGVARTAQHMLQCGELAASPALASEIEVWRKSIH